MAFNLQMKQDFHASDSNYSLKLVELAAMSQVEGIGDDPPPTGTCCPTLSRAICIVGSFYVRDVFYIPQGDY